MGWIERTDLQVEPSGGGSSVSPPTVNTYIADNSLAVGAQTFTWTKPAGAVRVKIEAVGPGGCGGSGRRGAASTVRAAGSGGASGMRTVLEYMATDLPSTLTIVVGAGLKGADAVTTNDTNGNQNFSGATQTTVHQPGSYATMYAHAWAGNNGGAGAASTSGPAGGSVLVGSSGSAGGAGGSPSYQNVGTTQFALNSSGGNGGCGISATNVAGIPQPGASVLPVYLQGQSHAGGSAVDGRNGLDGIVSVRDPLIGTGGVGGDAGIATNAGRGGHGVGPGAGGGGGGASLNGFNSGAGGNGGPGAVRITTYFA